MKIHSRHSSENILGGPFKDYELLPENDKKNQLKFETKYLVYEHEKEGAKEVKKKEKVFAFIKDGYRYFWNPNTEVYDKELIEIPNPKIEQSNSANNLKKKERKLVNRYPLNEYGLMPKKKNDYIVFTFI